MNKTIFVTGIFFGLTAVLLGAFGAHGLEKMVDAKAIETFETGVRYQMYHALFLLLLGGSNLLVNERKKLIYYFIVVGIVCFSFSISFWYPPHMGHRSILYLPTIRLPLHPTFFYSASLRIWLDVMA